MRSSSSHPADVDKYYLPPSGVQRGCGVQGLWRAFGPGQSVYSRTRDQARRLLIYLATVIDDSAAGALAACRPAARAPLIRVPSSHTCVRGSLESHACPTEESVPSAVCRRSGSAAAASSATSTASVVASASTAAFPDHRRRHRRRRRRIAATATPPNPNPYPNDAHVMRRWSYLVTLVSRPSSLITPRFRLLEPTLRRYEVVGSRSALYIYIVDFQHSARTLTHTLMMPT